MNRRVFGRVAALAVACGVGTPAAAAPRSYEGTAAARWPADAEDDLPAAAPAPTQPAGASVPPPRVDANPGSERLAVAIGLAPEAPGNAMEREWLDRLERSTRVSPDPLTTVRRLRPGVGDARSICRDRTDDVVVLIGYVPRREEPVLLPYDCRLDVALGIRAMAAADDDAFVGALWAEREELRRQGMSERRRIGRLSSRARIGIVAGVAVVVIGVAVGLLVANALRDEKVVVKVSP